MVCSSSSSASVWWGGGSSLLRRLRDFKRITLDPGETKNVKFTIDRKDVGFYDNSGRFVVEPGKIKLYVGNGSKGGRKTTFTATG